jgi:hypothetical protein
MLYSEVYNVEKLPWVLTVLFGCITAWSWTLHQINPSEAESNALKNSDLVLPFTKETTANRSNDDADKRNVISYPLPPKIKEMMKNPEVAKYLEEEIERRAEEKAKIISLRRVENFKKNEEEKKSEEVHTYMDNLESFFMDSIDAYAEEFSVDDDTKSKLALLVENGFQKQRTLYRQLVEKEITEEEYGELSAQAKKEDREETIELLGEEGAEEFGTVLKKEGRKAKERDTE